MKRHATSRISRRFLRASPVIAVLAIALGASYSALAFVRLQAGPVGLFWAGATSVPVQYVISSVKKCPGITDGSDAAAIRISFQRWQDVPTTAIRFQENTNSSQKARTDWQSFDINQVFFDVDGSSGMFTNNSGLVAVTPVNFNPQNGQILSADIVFNAKNHSFTTSDQPGRFDVESIATHEVGHFLGLDHSPNVGATLNPFAFTQDTRLRSLEQDDVAGVSTVYPRVGLGSITGSVQRVNLSPISGAHVVAEDVNGVPVSGTLSRSDGSFTIQGLPSGSYIVYAEPLDGAVRGDNLSLATSGLTIQTDFQTTYRGGVEAPTQISVSGTTSVGAITCGGAIAMNITGAGPAAMFANDRISCTVFGTGLLAGDFVSITGSGFTVTNASVFSAGISFTLDTAPGVQPTLRTIRVIRPSTGAVRVLTGGMEVRALPPFLTGISPSDGPPGTAVSLSGGNFQAGAKVVIGGAVVTNVSAAGGLATFPVPSIPNGTYDVAIANPDGQFAKILQAFSVTGSQAPAGSDPPDAGGSSLGPPGGGPTQPNSQQVVVPSSSGGGGGCAIAGTPGSPLAAAPFVAAAVALVLARRRRVAV